MIAKLPISEAHNTDMTKCISDCIHQAECGRSIGAFVKLNRSEAPTTLAMGDFSDQCQDYQYDDTERSAFNKYKLLPIEYID